jgi:hypothetical protein
MKYTADFETTTDPLDCRVWAYALCTIDDRVAVSMGNDIADFMNLIFTFYKPVIYFHNLKFDGVFIMCYLFANDFIHVTDRADKTNKSFSTLISNQGQFYSIDIYLDNNTIHIYDSYKLLPFKVEKIAKDFKLPIKKGEIDYNKPRPLGHVPDKEEREYITNDVMIMAMALKELFSKNLVKMTLGSNAISNYKKSMDFYKFERLFPPPEYDGDIRQAYKGGYTYVNEAYQNKEIGSGSVYDVNSLYPSIMGGDYKLPYGEGKFFEGQYKQNNLYNLYIQMFSCNFELKKGYLPILQIKGVRGFFLPTEYVKSSKGETVILCLTNVDLQMFFEHYEVYNIEYISGWMFKSTIGLFHDYVNFWMNEKNEAKKNNQGAQYTIAKLMLNSLYGKFALNPNITSKIPFYLDETIVYKMGEVEQRQPIYLPVSAFITAYSRQVTITACQNNYDRFIYTDTDSIHLLGHENPEGIEIDRARFIRAKRYIEIGTEPNDDEVITKIVCSGMPESCHEQVTFDNFIIGTHYKNKLVPVNVKGGVVLIDRGFTLIG